MSKQSFSDKAREAGLAAQAAMDMMEAQIKHELEKRRIQMKTSAGMANLTGSRMDKARMEQERAAKMGKGSSEEAPDSPLGPEPFQAPLPDPRDPSNGISGAQVPTTSDLFSDPSGISGGGSIQEATGGLGRETSGGATNPGLNPGYLQSQVPQELTSTRTTEKTVPVQYPGFVANVPQTTVETVTEPNSMTPYQLGQLNLYHQRSRLQHLKTLYDAEGHLAEDLAGTLYGVASGHINPDYLDVAKQAAAASLVGLGLPKERIDSVWARALANYGKYSTEQIGKHSTEFSKLVHDRDMEAVGSPRWNNFNDRIAYLVGRDPRSNAEADWYKMMQRGPVIEIQSQNSRQVHLSSILRELISIGKEHPEAFGASGTIMRGVTSVGGAIEDLSNLFSQAKQDQLVVEASDYMNKMWEDSIGPDGKLDDESATLLKAYRDRLYNPELKGSLDQLEAALRILFAGAYFKTLNVRAVETVMKERIILTGGKGAKEALSGLETALNEVEDLRKATELHMQSVGIPILPYERRFTNPTVPSGALNTKPLPQQIPGVPVFTPSRPPTAPNTAPR